MTKAIIEKYDKRNNGTYDNSNDQQIGFIYFNIGGWQNPTQVTGPQLKFLMHQPSSWASCGFGVPLSNWNIGDIKSVYIYGIIAV